jgi:hypothetical protein
VEGGETAYIQVRVEQLIQEVNRTIEFFQYKVN